MKIGIFGAGGQARVISEILLQTKKHEILAFIDKPMNGISEEIDGIPVIGKFPGDPEIITRLCQKGMKGFIVAVGNNLSRKTLFTTGMDNHLSPVNAIHPLAKITDTVKLGDGVVIAIAAIVCSHSDIGNNVIINSGSIIEHECIVEDHAHIAPGAILGGRTKIGKGSFIGAGAIIKEKIIIGENATVGAGSVVLQDIPDFAVAVGSPAKVIRINSR